MSARDVTFALMTLSHVAGCRGKTATEILAEAVGEIVRLQSALDQIAKMEPWAAQYSDWNRVARTALEYKEGKDEQI